MPGVRERDRIDLLRWAAGEVGLRAEGFRRVRDQVCKRLVKRMAALKLGPQGYRTFLAAHPEERAVLEELCRVHVSRFCRDRAVFEALAERVLPALAGRSPTLRAWSAGCAGGEEPYSLALLWHLRVAAKVPGGRLQILATDADPASLERARRACYPRASLRELPAGWRERAFVETAQGFCLRAELRAGVELGAADLRREAPEGPFHLILCRNLAFTYFAEAEQRAVAARLAALLAPGGALVIGARERLPDPPPLVRDASVRGLYFVPSPWSTP
jgi:chemotaxis protein methyltransferase CheR